MAFESCVRLYCTYVKNYKLIILKYELIVILKNFIEN